MSDDRRTSDDGSTGRPGSFESDMDSFDPEEFGGPLFGATVEQPITSIDDTRKACGRRSSQAPHDTARGQFHRQEILFFQTTYPKTLHAQCE